MIGPPFQAIICCEFSGKLDVDYMFAKLFSVIDIISIFLQYKPNEVIVFMDQARQKPCAYGNFVKFGGGAVFHHNKAMPTNTLFVACPFQILTMKLHCTL